MPDLKRTRKEAVVDVLNLCVIYTFLMDDLFTPAKRGMAEYKVGKEIENILTLGFNEGRLIRKWGSKHPPRQR